MTIAWSLQPARAFPSLCAEWDELAHKIGDLPFLESIFLRPLLEIFGKGNEHIALARRDGQIVAAAILEPKGLAQWQTFQPSQLPLGAWIALPGESLEALTKALLPSLPGLSLGLGITQLDPLFCKRPDDAGNLRSLDYIDTAWVDVRGEFSDYWNQRGKNLRTNVKKQKTKLAADGIEAKLDILTRPEDVAAAIGEYSRLEASGWKAETGTAVSEDNAQVQFYSAMMERFCAAGRGQIWRYRFGDATVAMDLCISAGDTLVILKTAFDAVHKSVSPATLMHHDAFNTVFDAKQIRRIEFYGRVMEWHTRWTTESRRLFHVTALRWSTLHRLRDWVAARRSQAIDAHQAVSESNA